MTGSLCSALQDRVNSGWQRGSFRLAPVLNHSGSALSWLCLFLPPHLLMVQNLCSQSLAHCYDLVNRLSSLSGRREQVSKSYLFMASEKYLKAFLVFAVIQKEKIS